MTVKQFEKLSKKRKAVLVAQDVLAQIKAKKYIAATGNYVSLINTENIQNNKQINTQFDNIKECEVCALGSMLMSCTHLGNKLTFKDIGLDLKGLSWDSDKVGLDDLKNKKVEKLFSSIFDDHTLLMIETAFESYEHNSNYYGELEKESFEYHQESTRYGESCSLTFEEVIACNKFYKKYSTDEGRLKAICNNIVKNEGSFIIK